MDVTDTNGEDKEEEEEEETLGITTVIDLLSKVVLTSVNC